MKKDRRENSIIEFKTFESGFLRQIGIEASDMMINHAKQIISTFYIYLDEKRLSILDFEKLDNFIIREFKESLEKKYPGVCFKNFEIIQKFIANYKKYENYYSGWVKN